MKVVMGLNNGLHNVPVRIKPDQSSLAPPPLIIIIIMAAAHYKSMLHYYFFKMCHILDCLRFYVRT